MSKLVYVENGVIIECHGRAAARRAAAFASMEARSEPIPCRYWFKMPHNYNELVDKWYNRLEK